MTTAADVSPGYTPAPRIVWASFNVFSYVPRMPGCALQVLFHLLGTQEPGGRCIGTQAELASELGMERTMVSRGLQHLQFASMLSPVRRGIYQLHPQLSAWENPRDQVEVVSRLKRSERLDVPDFEERYQQRVQAHEEQKRSRPRRAKVTALPLRVVD